MWRKTKLQQSTKMTFARELITTETGTFTGAKRERPPPAAARHIKVLVEVEARNVRLLSVDFVSVGLH